MWSTERTVAAGDTVIIWLTRDQLQPLVIAPGKDLNTKFGNFKHSDLVGVPYGSKVPSRAGKGFVHVLRPTPELWTLALPHRTQILYLADIAFITAALGVRSGSRVVEAGTGSASFSHSIARTLGPTGRLFSFEFHEARYLKACEEFARHGMGDVVQLEHRNVCKDGFGEGVKEVEGVDAVFLDLPAPWDAVGFAKEAMRKDRVARICCFSPCIEQVLRTVSALNEAGFTEITMYETLQRPIEVFQTPAPPSVAGLAAQLKHAEVRREEKRQRQIAANKKALKEAREAKAKEEGKCDEGGKRKREAVDGEEGEGMEEDKDKEDWVNVEPEHKRARTDVDTMVLDSEGGGEASSSTLITPASTLNSPAVASTSTSTSTPTITSTPNPTTPPTPQIQKVNVSKALAEVRGHTSYLTFASLVPVPASFAAAASSKDDVSGGGGTTATQSNAKSEEAAPAPTDGAALVGGTATTNATSTTSAEWVEPTVQAPTTTTSTSTSSAPKRIITPELS